MQRKKIAMGILVIAVVTVIMLSGIISYDGWYSRSPNSAIVSHHISQSLSPPDASAQTLNLNAPCLVEYNEFMTLCAQKCTEIAARVSNLKQYDFRIGCENGCIAGDRIHRTRLSTIK